MKNNYFTGPLFYDGYSWNFLVYNDNKVEVNQIIGPKKEDPYNGFIDRMVISSIIDNELYLYFDKSLVILSIFEKKLCLFKRKYIKVKYKFIPTKYQHYCEIKIAKKLELVGEENWDTIAEFLNNACN